MEEDEEYGDEEEDSPQPASNIMKKQDVSNTSQVTGGAKVNGNISNTSAHLQQKQAEVAKLDKERLEQSKKSIKS
jgi:hypothetical protein